MSGRPRRVSVGQSEFQHRFGGPPVHRYDEEHKTVLYAYAQLADFRMPDVSTADQGLLAAMGYPFTQIGGKHYLPQG